MSRETDAQALIRRLTPKQRSRVLAWALEEWPVPDELTIREMQVLSLFRRFPNWTILRLAGRLGMAAKTLETHQARIRAKLKVPLGVGREGLVDAAERAGLF